VIINAPTQEGLTGQAIRLYFSAWVGLGSIIADFRRYFDLDMTEGMHNQQNEWAEYLDLSQSELQAIVAIIQQSNELALKARICSVSPFLLLLKTDTKFSTTNANVDFADLRTLDAVDLPGVVNSVCAKPLSQRYIQGYSQLRSMRNQIAHLGGTATRFVPEELMHMLIAQYIELWEDRAWLQDRVEAARTARRSFFHDYKYASPEAEVMDELPFTFHLLRGAEFKGLFKRSRTKRRYLCTMCVDRATTKWNRDGPDFTKTAYLANDGAALECVMCGEIREITRRRCGHAGCVGDVISTTPEPWVSIFCNTCGETSELNPSDL
jgi:hypothetical protein